MEIWLDTSNLELISEAHSMGILYGVTTNPSIVKNSGLPFEKLLNNLLDAQEGPVAAQVVAKDDWEMVQQGMRLHDLSKRIIVKVPANRAGYKCMHALVKKGVSVLATTIYEPKQALLSFIAGACYLAPYMGRIRDSGKDPNLVLKDILDIKRNYSLQAKILGAGIRNIEDMMFCAALGICSITIPDRVFETMISENAGVKKSLDEFSKDWSNTKQKE